MKGIKIICRNCKKETPLEFPLEIMDRICFRCGEWNTLVLVKTKQKDSYPKTSTEDGK